MKDGEYRITMLDCAEGDCFFLEFRFDSMEYTILMDTGPGACWITSLKPFLDQLIAKKKKINVLVITHIDNDHIGGAIKLFQSEEYSCLVEEVWFNGLKQVLNIDAVSSVSDNQAAYQRLIFQHQHNDSSDGVHDISAKQALSLGCLLTSCRKTTRRITCDTPPVILTDNFRIDFLLPTASQLTSLQKYFLRHLRRVGGGNQIVLTPEGEIAFEHLMRDDDTIDSGIHHISKTSLDVHQIEKWAEAKANKDQSVTNTSSIAICITFYGKCFLFPGDAAGQDILEAVENKNLPTDYEIIKLPHHGSNRNCLSLPEKLNTKYTLQKSDIDTIQFCSFLTLPESRPFQPLLLRVAADDREITASTRILWPDAPAPIDSYSFTYKAVSKWLPECGYRANITLEPSANALSTYSGFSGAPIIVGNCIDGLLTLERTDGQKAVRVYGIVGTAFQNILKEANIHFLSHKENPANPCLFNPEKYSEYLQTCLNKSSSLPLENQEYLKDRLLFDEMNNFVFGKWSHHLLADLRLDNDTNKLLKGFIDEIGNYESMEKITASLKSKVQSALDCKTIPQKFRIPIMNKLDSPLYDNCMFISGYFGSGKTRLAIEAARSMCPLHYKPNSPVFLIVRPSVPDNLNTSLVKAFFNLLGSENTLSEYMDAFTNHTLVIVLDDVHEYFQSGIVMKDLRDLIKEHSRPYVKWMIIMQTGAGTDINNLYNNYFERYAHAWSRNLSYFLIRPWFQLDAWYRHQDLPAQMLQDQLSVPLHNWIWKKSVSSTIYYNPLLIGVLLVYEQNNEGQSIFTYNDFLFPTFCDTFFYLLSLGNPSVKRDAESIAKHLQTVHSLRFHSVDGIDFPQIKILIERGLLMDTNQFPAVYQSIPDIIWYYLISQVMNAEFPLSGQNVRTILQNIYWENNPADFNNILSIWVLSGERSSDDMIRIWKTLFDCHFEQVALDTGFKCDPFLRNALIRISLEHPRALQQHFSLLMHLCALGQIEKKLFHKLIADCIEKCANQLKNNTELFAYMLLQNYQNMSWENVLETLSHLAPILNIDANADFLCRLGRDIGRTVAQKADMVDQLDEAIRNACAACNGDISNKKYSPPDEQYHSFPVELFDGFCSDFCNTIIQEYNIEGYEKFDAAGWYSYEKKTKPNQYRRNLALTFALAHEYRYQIQAYRDEDDYVYWYKFKLVKPLSEGDVAHKKFALYLIIHTELRENHYKIEENGFFWKIADTLRRDKSMRNVLEGNTCKTFYKYNFDGQTYSPKYRDNHYQRRGRKKERRK